MESLHRPPCHPYFLSCLRKMMVDDDDNGPSDKYSDTVGVMGCIHFN